MTRLLAQVLMWLALAAVVIVAGAHTIYYLLFWEWSRASFAATAFVAALLVAVTILLLGRLRRIEARLDLLLAEEEAVVPRVVGALAETSDVEPRPDFPWLARPPALLLGLLAAGPRPDEAVFIPVFLAAGLIVSAVAAGVERLAAFVQERRRAQQPAARDLIRERTRGTLFLVPIGGLVVVALAVGGLYLASHYWSEPIGEGVTTMTVEVDNRGPATSEIDVVETLGRYCTYDTGVGISFAGVEAGPGGTTLLRVEPLLDDDAQRRYTGCLEDALLEWHRVTVTDTALAPE